MKNLILFWLVSLSFSDLTAQTIEFSGGTNLNRFFDFQREDHYFSNYTYELGYSIRVGLEDIKIDSSPVRFALNITKYGGKIDIGNVALGGGSYTDAIVKKYTIGLGIYPLNFKIYKKLSLNFGAEFSFLSAQSVKGNQYDHTGGFPDHYVSLDNSAGLNNNFYVGIISRIGYYIAIEHNCYIVPQYLFYFGLSNEFLNSGSRTKSMRHYLEISIISPLQ